MGGMAIEVVPVEGDSHEGRQWGYAIVRDGRPEFRVHTGGTGPCWNIREVHDEDGFYFHICDLDEMIEALTALRDSEAHRENVRRWA